MSLSKDSGLVKVWVNLVKSGRYTLNQVPKIYNLRSVVNEIVNESVFLK